MSRLKEFISLRCLLGERVMGACATRWYRRIARMEKWTPAEVEAWQREKLQEFIRHAYEHTVYYRNLFDSLGIKPEEIKTKEDLKRLPVITKEIVHAHYEELIPDDLSSFKENSERND